MQSVWHVLSLIALDLVLLIGLLGIPLGLGGNFILLGSAVFIAILAGFPAVWWIALIVMAVAVVMGEVIEAFLGSLVAKKYGASKWGMFGAFAGGIVGGILGTMVLPLIGSIIGSFIGAAAGAMGLELLGGQQAEPGMRAGWGAFVGKMMATGIKMAIGVAIAVYIVIQTH